MVTKPNTPIPVSGEEPLKKAPKVPAMEPVSGNAFPGKPQVSPNDALPKTFKLPDSVSAADVKADSFRYGGGRTAGGGTPSAPDRAGRRS